MAVTPPRRLPSQRCRCGQSPAVLVGQTAAATATVADSVGNVLSGRVVTWGSSNATVASVDATGTVRAIAAGSALIKRRAKARAARHHQRQCACSNSGSFGIGIASESTLQVEQQCSCRRQRSMPTITCSPDELWLELSEHPRSPQFEHRSCEGNRRRKCVDYRSERGKTASAAITVSALQWQRSPFHPQARAFR